MTEQAGARPSWAVVISAPSTLAGSHWSSLLDRAWARAITAAGILSPEECRKIVTALDEIEKPRTDRARPGSDNSNAEDVHHFVETALIEKLGPFGAKLHTGRSRNEMVAAEFRM